MQALAREKAHRKYFRRAIFPFESMAINWPKVLIGDHRHDQIFTRKEKAGDSRRLKACDKPVQHCMNKGSPLIRAKDMQTF